MNDERRVILESIAYGDDKRISPADRLRAMELLPTPSGLGPFGLDHLGDEELNRALAQYMTTGADWQPPDPGEHAPRVDEWGVRLLDAIASEGDTTRFPLTTERVAALAEAMLPEVDRRRVAAAADQLLAERARAQADQRAAEGQPGKVVQMPQQRPSAAPQKSEEERAALAAGEFSITSRRQEWERSQPWWLR